MTPPGSGAGTDTTAAGGRPAVDSVWFNCAVGVAGDMLLGALVDAGADPARIAADIAAVGVDGYELAFQRVQRAGLAAARAVVTVDEAPSDDAHGHPHRPVGKILELLERVELAERTRRRARAVFEELGRAEGAVHGIDPADVELHEVGSVDAIVDVVGVCSALQSLGAEHVTASAVGLGHGTVGTAHGMLAHPAPAVARMLADHAVPVVGHDTPLELATPTGVACLVTLCDSFGAPPPMTVMATGFGAGGADPPDRPNVVGVLVGAASASARSSPDPGGAAVLIDTNVDDVSGEVLAHTIAALLGAGAHDAWATPTVMKKGRPAHTISVLAALTDEDRLRRLLVSETGTLGSRSTTVRRHPEPRADETVSLDGVELRLKRSADRVKIEYDDAVAASERLGIPLRDVVRRAEHLATGDDGD